MNSRTSGLNKCDAAREIRDAWGIRKSDPSWAEKLPLFVAEVKRIFTAEELRGYFATTTRVGRQPTSRPMNSI